MVPAMPGFYHRPQSLLDIIDMQVMKVMDQMGIHRDLVKRWGSKDTGSNPGRDDLLGTSGREGAQPDATEVVNLDEKVTCEAKRVVGGDA